MKWKYLVSVAAIAYACVAGAATGDAGREQALKQEAVERLAQSHDPALSVGIGRVYVKQAALLAAREVLAERGRAAGLDRVRWNPDTPQWQAAERDLMHGIDDLVQQRVADGAWVRQAWAALAAQTLNGEEADEVAVHFQSEGGQLQRRVIEWFVGELTLQTYTFTDRLKYGVAGSEQEMRDLQEVTYERIFHGIHDFTGYPNAVRFASSDPGVKYFKMMVMQGVHAVHAYLEACAEAARELVRGRASLADAHVASVLGAGS
ncbi:MAG: hypothetical protein KIS79_10720 [Burkholderiales bacterium]|nr:hypothetical protein [Burkholderiales bacterium]